MGCQLGRFQRGSWGLPLPVGLLQGGGACAGPSEGPGGCTCSNPPTSQMGPCDSGSARQEGKASRRGVCPARSPWAPQRHILDHAGLNHKVSALNAGHCCPCAEWPQLVGKL